MRLLKKRVLIPLVALAALYFAAYSQYEVPVLMYHHVGEARESSSNTVSTLMFEKQMEFLKVHRYNVVSLEDLLGMIKEGASIPRNTVCITFDDGNLDNFKNAFPILRKMRFRATIFMITDNINKKGWLSEEDLKILDGSGVAIGSHTASHAYLPDHTAEEVIAELRESRNHLEKILGHPVFLFSYPAGGFTEEIKHLVVSEGFRGAVTTNRGKDKHDPYALRRVKITEGGGSLFNFWIKVSGLQRLGKSVKSPS
jgi:peptidoglycan/xylan/chitin deacetylase (PgdA/CDA1 family)